MRNRSRCAALLLLATTLLPYPAIAGSPLHLWARNDYPIPAERPTRVFFLQRSMNAHTIVYEARLAPGGGLDPAQPIEAYWVRSSGERRPLDFVEHTLAFGPVVKKDPSTAGAWLVRAAGYAARSARLALDAQGKPVLIGEVAGRPARLVSGHLELAGTGYVSRVLAVDLYGIDMVSGAWLHERFVP